MTLTVASQDRDAFSFFTNQSHCFSPGQLNSKRASLTHLFPYLGFFPAACSLCVFKGCYSAHSTSHRPLRGKALTFPDLPHGHGAKAGNRAVNYHWLQKWPGGAHGGDAVKPQHLFSPQPPRSCGVVTSPNQRCSRQNLGYSL